MDVIYSTLAVHSLLRTSVLHTRNRWKQFVFPTVILNIPALRLSFANMSVGCFYSEVWNPAKNGADDQQLSIYEQYQSCAKRKKKREKREKLSFYLTLLRNRVLSRQSSDGDASLPNSLGDLCQQSRSWTHARIVGERKESEQAEVDDGRSRGRAGGHADSRCRGEHATAKESKSR